MELKITTINNNDVNAPIKLVIVIDGLSLSKSSKSTFWPILCYIRPNSNIVFPIGLYWDSKKPKKSNDYLNDFFLEIRNLVDNRIELQMRSGKNINKRVILDLFCCDLPTKNFILKIKGHKAYFSCSRRYIDGEYLC